jgi:glycosyltransferase involved in cell wall biosynthesis
MKVFYDGLAYKLHAQGGISRYFTNLINLLPSQVMPVVAFHDATSHSQLSRPNLQKKIYPGASLKLGALSAPLKQYYFQSMTQSCRATLFHPTYYWLSTGRSFQDYKQPVVLTVHDMIHEIFSAQMDPENQYARAKQAAVLAADRIICVSENTKKDLLEHCPVSEDRIQVIHLASEIDASMSHGDEAVPTQPYYLYVGSRNPNYKNFNTLLDAFAQVAAAHSEAVLCVVGSALRSDEMAQVNALRIADRLHLFNNVSDRHLAKLYRCSLAFVYPSLYEGFGIPPLEAMACGTPVIAANRASIPEVVGDGGILFEPHAIQDLADILLNLYESPTARERLIEQGTRRVQRFSWQKMADQTFEVYQSLSPSS